jgi:hypothetical protein
MRLPRIFWILLKAHARWQARRAARVLADFKPERILTIQEQFGWLTAAELARRLDVPLNLILHDDWYRNLPMAAALKPKFEEEIGSVYRSAASRLCISPYMEVQYAIRYGAAGTVLYPSRARNGMTFNTPPESTSKNAGALKFAYGGNVFHKGYWESLRDLASALESAGGRLLIYGPTMEQIRAENLDLPNVTAHGFVFNMIEAIREQADVLFLPMTFEAQEQSNMEVSFPSKLAEYTAAGLPLLIYGPAYCSAVRWARENSNSAEVVSQQGSAGLERAIEKLSDPARRADLAVRAIELGARFFSFDSAFDIFLAAIRSGGPSAS